jgi:hypothetical protein
VTTLLGGRRRFTQRLGERSEDPVCWFSAGDVLRPVLHGRLVLGAVPRGDIAIDLYRHHGIEFRMIEEVGVVTGQLAVMTDPPTIVSEPWAVAKVAVERRLVERRHVTDKRVEPLVLLCWGEQTFPVPSARP